MWVLLRLLWALNLLSTETLCPFLILCYCNVRKEEIKWHRGTHSCLFTHWITDHYKCNCQIIFCARCGGKILFLWVVDQELFRSTATESFKNVQVTHPEMSGCELGIHLSRKGGNTMYVHILNTEISAVFLFKPGRSHRHRFVLESFHWLLFEQAITG